MISKKIKILISGALVCFLVISSPFQKSVKAIAVIDDALLLAGAGILTIAGVGAYMGLKDSDLTHKLANSVTDSISDFGNSAKQIYNNLAFGYDVSKMLPSLLAAYAEHLEGAEGEYVSSEPVQENNFTCYYYSSGTVFEGVATSSGSFSYNVNELDNCNNYNHWSASCSFKSGDTVKFVLRYVHDEKFQPSYPECYMLVCFVNNVQTSYAYTYLDKKCNNFRLSIPSEFSFNNIVLPTVFQPLPAITDTSSYPTSISLSKDKVNEYVGEYVEEHPEDNDNKPDYTQLIPFMLDLLEKDLGNGEITPQNLSNSGVFSYVLPDNSTMGYYPYYLSSDSGDDVVVNDGNVNVTVNNNIGSGSDVSDEEKNGVLNLIDGGFRATTERFENLSESFAGFKNTISGIFSFFPQDVQNILFLSIILMLIFFILGLRR